MKPITKPPLEPALHELLKIAGSVESLKHLCEYDAQWAEKYLSMSTNPWTSGILPLRFVELICVGINAACTNLQPTFVRKHIRAALQAGATGDEILEVLKCAAAMAIHSCSLGAPILIEEAKTAGIELPQRSLDKIPTPSCDQMRAIGQWNDAWNPFFQIDPQWTDQFFAVGTGIYQSKTLTAKELELLSIAFDASFTHMYAPGTRRHIKAALRLGATIEEVMEVLKICVAQGVTALEMTVPILFEELENFKSGCSADPA